MDRSSVFLLCLFTVPRRDIVNFTLIASRGELPRHSNRLSRKSISMYGYRLSPALLTVRPSLVSCHIYVQCVRLFSQFHGHTLSCSIYSAHGYTVLSRAIYSARGYTLSRAIDNAHFYTLSRYLQCVRLYILPRYYSAHSYTLPRNFTMHTAILS